MKTGDLVIWTYKGQRDPKMMGVIVSDYAGSKSEDGSVLKNVYWFNNDWIRPIEQRFLEVTSETMSVHKN